MKLQRVISTRIVVVAFAAALLLPAYPRKLKVKIDHKAVQEQKENLSDSSDTLNIIKGDLAASAVRCFGYDKPHNSYRESLFVTNLLDADTIKVIDFEVEYLAVNGEELHRRVVREECEIPPGESKRLQFNSWDGTRTFYYFRTPPPRKTGLNPYKVNIHPIQVQLKCINP